MSFLNIFIPFFCFCLNVISQVLSYKTKITRNLLKSEYIGFIAGFIALLACELPVYLSQSNGRLFLSLINLIIYLSFSYCYFQFINMGETARRIRLLRELYETPKGETKEQILTKYNSQEIISIRIKRLLNNNQIIIHDNKYFLKGTIMFFITKIILLMKWLILGAKSKIE